MYFLPPLTLLPRVCTQNTCIHLSRLSLEPLHAANRLSPHCRCVFVPLSPICFLALPFPPAMYCCYRLSTLMRLCLTHSLSPAMRYPLQEISCYILLASSRVLSLSSLSQSINSERTPSPNTLILPHLKKIKMPSPHMLYVQYLLKKIKMLIHCYRLNEIEEEPCMREKQSERARKGEPLRRLGWLLIHMCSVHRRCHSRLS